MKRRRFSAALVVIFTAALACGQPATSAKDNNPQVSVRANTQFVQGSVLRLKGNVEISTNQFIIRADEAAFNVTSGLIEARGQVRAVAVGRKSIDDALVSDRLVTDIYGRNALFQFRKP